MNIDIDSQIEFGDDDGLRHFLFDHLFVHLQTAGVIANTYNQFLPSIGLLASSSEDAWASVMAAGVQGQETPTPIPLIDWLNLHSDLHAHEYAVIAPSLLSPDLSEVDFSKADQFNDWMQAHQEIHDIISQSLNILS